MTMRVPPIVARVPLPNACGVAASGRHAFVACKRDGVYGLDLSNPTQPRVLGALNPEGLDARRLVVSHGRLFVAGFNGGLYCYDVRDPSHPVLVSRLSSDAMPLVMDVFAWGAYVFLAGADHVHGRFVVVDATDLSAPRAIGLHTNVAAERASYESVAFDGHHVFLGGNQGELHILNAQQPAQLYRVGEYFSRGTELEAPSVWGITLMQGGAPFADPRGARPASSAVAFLSDWGAGLVAVDVRNPMAPREIGVFRDNTHGANTYRAVLHGTTLYVANGWGGVQGVDVADPARMQLLWDLEPARSSYTDVVVVGPFLLAVNNGNPQGLDVVRVA